MTTRRFTRRTRNPVRRVFFTGTGTQTTLNSTMVDLTPVPEITGVGDSQYGDLLVTGVALIDLVDEAAVHQVKIWVGRTSTEPSQQDTGVRTRQIPANSAGLPYVVRIRGLRVDPGQFCKLFVEAIAETDAAIIHQQIVSVKWSFRELAKG